MTRTGRGRAATQLLVATLVTSLTAWGLALAGAGPASADTAPPAETPATVSADQLPTWQINGVVWSQVTVGNVVYATGEFDRARPPGVPAGGPGEVAVGNIIAYDIRTGDRIASFDHTLNAQGMVVTKSPDGSRVYVGGDFTTVDGRARSHVAAFDSATGALLNSFQPTINGQVRALAATNDTVYAGGSFMSAEGAARTRLASFAASNGAMTDWAPSADDGYVWSMVVTPDRSKVVIGGQFTNLSGTTVNGMGAVDASTATVQPWAANSVIQDSDHGAITALRTDGSQVYGSGFAFGSGSTFEGAFALDPGSGEIHWLNDCHGDTYDVFPVGRALYTVSHAHDCRWIGEFPQTDPWSINMRHALAFTTYADGVNTGPDNYGWNFSGQPAASLLQWYPELLTGKYTGQGQAAWSVTGNADYVALGGEFPGVNNKGQQGLVRFAVRSKAPNKRGPVQADGAAPPAALATTPGTLRVAWRSSYDMDNAELTYDVYRDSGTAPVHSVTTSSNYWTYPSLGFYDKGLAPGSSHTYTVKVTDPLGNVQTLPTTNRATVSSETASPYSADVVADGATAYWRLGEPSGSAVHDYAGFNDASARSGVSRGADGAIEGDSDTASTFDGTSTGSVASDSTVPTTPSFTAEAWIRTTTTTGGKILGYGSARTGNSSSYDRHVYMDDAGRLVFGVYPGGARTLTSAKTYNDGEWHHVVATLGSSAGTALYVDGKRVARDPGVTSAQDYSGYWRIGGDNLKGWPDKPTSSYFAGTIDDVAIYPTALSRTTIQQHYTDSGRTVAIPPKPTDAYGAAVYKDSPSLYWRLGEASGPTAKDVSPNEADGTYTGGITFGRPGAVDGTTDTAVTFDGTDGQLNSNASVSNPIVYSEELWFSTTTTSGGKLIGFGNAASGLSSNYDRHVWMEDDGRLSFGVWAGQSTTVTSPDSYNDGSWHHLVAEQGPDGMKLYVDGLLVGSDLQTQAQAYTGYWKVGGDTVWSGSSSYFAGTIDEVAVYGSALSQDQVRAHYRAGGGTLPNEAPGAVFTSAVSDLAVSVDGSGSSDPDGSVASWVWDFGDGSSGSGKTADHTFADAGTYTVTLTVTDDAGATGSVSHDVTVTAPPANQAPTAAFTSAVSDLAVSVDGSGSADPDGSVASYAWDFGDGSSGTGRSADHTFADAGTYTVTLTVTDDAGATGSVSHDVTVTAPPADGTVAADAFGRTVSGGWGDADTGGGWNLFGSASGFSVGGGVGTITVPRPGSGPGAFLPNVSSSDTDASVRVGLGKSPTGGGTFVSLVGRGTRSDNYREKVLVTSAGAVRVYVTKMVSWSESTLSARTVSGLTWQPGDTLVLRTQVVGTNPSTIRAKVWKAGTSEPAAWQLEETDSSAELQKAMGLGVVSYVSGSATNTPVDITFDDLTATSSSATPPPANEAPTAAFTSAVSDLAVSVDGSGSADPDGSVASYAWDFGDGSSGTGRSADHTFADAGTYTVTLTVTDDAGATGSVSHDVTVTAPPADGTVAADAFGRTVSGGWGDADTGGGWNLFGSASGFSVGGGVGTITVPRPGSGPGAFLPNVSSSDTDASVRVGLGKSPTGGGTFVSLVGRGTRSDNYREKVLVTSAGAVRVYVTKMVSWSESTLSARTVSGLTWQPGDTLVLRTQVVGTNPSTIRAKVWKAGTSEPAAWQLEETDSSAELQKAMGLGVVSYVSGSATNTPVDITFDDLTARHTGP